MSAHVESAFQRFGAYIRLPANQIHVANEAERQVLSLVSSMDGVVAAVPVGSMVRGTAVRQYSDLDLLATFLEQDSDNPFSQPSSLLAGLAEQLRRGFADAEVEEGMVAVSLKRRCWPTVDVIPAFLVDDAQCSEQVYRIPAGNGQLWQLYSPQSQNLLVESGERELGPRLKNLIRMIKWWNYVNGSFLASFGIEQLACVIFESAIPAYADAIHRFFEVAARQSDLKGLFIAGIGQVIEALDVALASSHAALRADAIDTIGGAKRAIIHWKDVFGDELPNIV
jgi:predicted nucleotidyltransferase